MEEAEAELSSAQAAYDADPSEENDAALQEAQSAYDEATEALAKVSGVTVDTLSDMREEGMGWGEIAHELGLHPSVLGLGHQKQIQTEELERNRNMKSFSEENGEAGSKGKALGLEGKAQKENQGKGGDKGKGSGKGNSSGGKGGGNGGGKK